VLKDLIALMAYFAKFFFDVAFIYPNAEEPEYRKGHTVVLGLLVFSWFMYVVPSIFVLATTE
jgi:hypothetical protein